MKVKLLSRVRLFATPMACSLSGFSVHGIFQQEYWSGLPFPSPGDLPNPGIELGSPTLQADALVSEPLGKSKHLHNYPELKDYKYMISTFTRWNTIQQWNESQVHRLCTYCRIPLNKTLWKNQRAQNRPVVVREWGKRGLTRKRQHNRIWGLNNISKLQLYF